MTQDTAVPTVSVVICTYTERRWHELDAGIEPGRPILARVNLRMQVVHGDNPVEVAREDRRQRAADEARGQEQ